MTEEKDVENTVRCIGGSAALINLLEVGSLGAITPTSVFAIESVAGVVGYAYSKKAAFRLFNSWA